MVKRRKHSEKVRIIGGEFRSRTLQTPAGDHTRPTASRTREALFALLDTKFLPHGFHDIHVVDLFAGSGALGIEALSRGAASLVAFESGGDAARVLAQNIDSLLLRARARVVTCTLDDTAPRLDSAPHLIFCDPPYHVDATKMLQNLSTQVRPNAILCYEHAKENRPVLTTPWRLRTRRTWGVATVSFFERNG